MEIEYQGNGGSITADLTADTADDNETSGIRAVATVATDWELVVEICQA